VFVLREDGDDLARNGTRQSDVDNRMRAVVSKRAANGTSAEGYFTNGMALVLVVLSTCTAMDDIVAKFSLGTVSRERPLLRFMLAMALSTRSVQSPNYHVMAHLLSKARELLQPSKHQPEMELLPLRYGAECGDEITRACFADLHVLTRVLQDLAIVGLISNGAVDPLEARMLTLWTRSAATTPPNMTGHMAGVSGAATEAGIWSGLQRHSCLVGTFAKSPNGIGGFVVLANSISGNPTAYATVNNPAGGGSDNGGRSGGGRGGDNNNYHNSAATAGQIRSRSGQPVDRGVRTCYSCGQVGHVAKDCTRPKKRNNLSGGKGRNPFGKAAEARSNKGESVVKEAADAKKA